MITGMTISDASFGMYKKTKEQLKGKKGLNPKKIKDVYNKHHNFIENYLPQEFEPKVNNRWLLTFPPDLGISQWFVKSTTRPMYPFDMNNIFHVQLYDPVWDSTTDKLITFLEGQKRGFKVKFEMLDPTGVVVEKWIYKGCKILKVHWGDLDYKDNNPVNITLVISSNEIKHKKIKHK